ncbi:LOW QUALITY PROTEIN: exocyst complex component EXO84B-like [Juglans microcarpa x Juglans regia]|uniref:LOW QUALITY PROTEIN: exocyst complex component EXO84B-like n=1 Tax=Juglans microcarpa x Juglans regia TaxID=2249226 RepID=UPI001B7E5AD4|nr:LOW QUALITY PROTEIN: exocyst complex component EXO84B-like [Juglans microcarpa x Juglans regia]
MDSSSNPSTFRFREMENSAHSDTGSDFSSVSSHCADDSDIQSMAGKGIKHLCSELLELKEESVEDFERNVFSNYSAFVRIFEEVRDAEKELMKLKNHVSTQKGLVKELVDGIYLEVLSEETIESIIEEHVNTDPPEPSELEAHVNDVSETLDLLLSENRIDEALAIVELEDENFQRMQFEGNAPSDMLMLYNSSLCKGKAMLTLQLTHVAENPRTTAPELQKALFGICRLGDSLLATHLLLEYYHLRIASGIHNLQCSNSYLHGTYIRDLAKILFSMISQAARSFTMLFGGASPRASELIRWACEETKVFVVCFNKYVKSTSEISGGLPKVVESVQFSMSFCSLLETQSLVLRPYLIKHIRPGMEVVLQIHIDHYKKVVSIFTATESWVLGRYLVSGVVNETCSSIMVGKQLEYCLLTSSGRKFVTLLQAITGDISPLVTLQMDGLILRGLVDLFLEYTIVLEKAITCDELVTEKGGSRINLAETLTQKVSVLVNLSTLEKFFSNIIRSTFGSTSHINSELMRNDLVSDQQEELDSCILFIQEASCQVRAHFCQQFIHGMMSMETGSKCYLETCIDGPKDLMPSIAFQVLFLELRKMEKLVEDCVFEVDWLMELLRELIEAVFVWISNNKEIYAISEEDLTVQHSDNFKKFALDMQFLVEISRYGGYFSKNSSVLVTYMKSAFLSAGLNPERDGMDDGWAINAVNEAITKLLMIEKRNMLSNDDSVGVVEEEELHENQSEHVSDSEDGARSYTNDSMKSCDDVEGNTALEADLNEETMIVNTESNPPREEDDGSSYRTAMNRKDSSVEIEDVSSKTAANNTESVDINNKESGGETEGS